jgi:hypothetical protein
MPAITSMMPYYRAETLRGRRRPWLRLSGEASSSTSTLPTSPPTQHRVGGTTSPGRALSFVRRNANFLVGGQPLSRLFSRQGALVAAGASQRGDKDTAEATNEAIIRFTRIALWRKLITTRDHGFVGMAPPFAAREM